MSKPKQLQDEDREDDVHVMPCYGPAHTSSIKCQCKPERLADEPRVVLHRDLN